MHPDKTKWTAEILRLEANISSSVKRMEKYFKYQIIGLTIELCTVNPVIIVNNERCKLINLHVVLFQDKTRCTIINRVKV